MDNDARSPAGRSLTLESLDYSSQIPKILVGKAYDFGAAADHNAELFRGKNNDIDDQAYDFGAAAYYNTDLLKRNNNETGELALPLSLSTMLLGSSYTATLAPETQVHMPVGFDSGESNEIFPAESNVEGISGQIATAPSFSPDFQELSTHGSHDVALRGQRGRLSCDSPGCKQTFPRKSE
ncbi:hypothetical protein BOTNAR_0101g00120 [Botryotinia narcissicola]|uniref:Uncharacterized protein n=1 Tax=Botryotinia narcissicola TaxID=278944 RepID=A0A4Z1IVE6_9HELO|nr:hypothetical protein BOTNAR_0101g00120 [Botryotinia narcissicola]